MTAIDELREVIGRVRRRWFWSVWAQAFAAMLVAAALLVGLGVATVRLAGLTGDLRLVVWALVLTLVAVVVGLVAWARPRRPTDARVARYIEERVPELDDTLVSAVDLDRRDAGGPLGDLVVRDAVRRVGTLDLNRVVPGAHLRRKFGGLAAAAAVLVAVLAIVWNDLATTWRQASLRFFPPVLTLVVEPGDTTVVENSTFTVTARIDGRPDDLALDGFELRVLTGNDTRGVPMTREGSTLRAVVSRVKQPFGYRVTGPLTSKTFQVRVQRPPRVERIDVSYKYPGYSGLPPRVDDDSGDVYAPAGTDVTLTVHTLDDVGAGKLAFDNGEAVTLASRGPKTLEAGFTVSKDAAYRVALKDRTGLASPGDTEYFVRVMTDRPPDVRLTRPGGDQKVTRLEEVVLEARADDDYGVASLDLVYSPKGGAEKVVPLHHGAPATTASGSWVMRIEELDVEPGDFVTAYARARDISRGKRSTEARSDIFFFEVRPFNQEFEAAQSSAMAGGSGGSPTDLAAQQKEIVVATWKLQRRSTAGRSTEDIRAVARAQAEVRARAERMAPRQPTRRTLRPGQPGATPQAAPNPFQDAIEAMGKAQKELEALSTEKAIPHEMAALNALLKAEAEIERRQVATQQQGGGRGGNTGNQDLSALFDRELQRQLKNNYENRASAEERHDETQNDALDKLKELAQRQDEISRQQRELARQQARLRQEEVKRQLERLTREQEEVRRQLEQLSKQMGGQPQNAQQGSTGQTSAQGGQNSQRVGDALEEMRRAMNDMQRSDPGQAGQRGEQAADRLRSAARDMEQPSPGDPGRAAGDLELEARELADSERRVANELGQAASGTTGRDDLRRLGGEQARLADRTEQLERRARQLAARGSASSADAGKQASQALGRGDVSERMRSAAEEMRDAAGGQRPSLQADLSKLAESTQELAKRLDSAGDALARGAGRDGDTTRLSDQLARTRALRDRLDATERRIEELSRNAGSERTGSASERGEQGERAQGTPQGRESSESRGQGQGRAPGQDGRASNEQNAAGNERGTSGRSREQGPAETSPSSQDPTSGQRGAGGGVGSGVAGEIARLQQQYTRDAKQARDLADALRNSDPELARRLTSPEGWEPSLSAPGTEAFKQDFARWDVLRRDVRLALETLEASLARRLSDKTARDRLEAGPDQRTPDAYRRRVAKYYESLARPPQ